MVKQAPTFGRIATMVLFALTCFGLLLFLWVTFGGPTPLKPQGYRIKVAFPEAAQLGIEADVRIAGVTVGKVRKKDIDPAHRNRTVATLELQPRYAPIASDANAILRQKTLLGETYVELTSGSRTAPKIKEGGWLADSRVADTTQLDDIFQALDPVTRLSFRSWQHELAGASRGRGKDLNDVLGNLPAFAASGDDLLTVLDAQSAGVRRLLRNTGTVFEAVTQDEGQLRNLITNSGDVFDATSSQQDALAETFRIFPTFLDESKTTLARLQRFARTTDPLIRELQPTLQDLRPTLADLRGAAPDLERLFRTLDPLITTAKKGFQATRDTLRGAQPVFARLQPFLQELNPILQWLEYHQRTVADFISNGAGALVDTVPTRTADERGHYLRQFGPKGVQSAAMFSDRRQVPGLVSRGNAYLNPSVLSGPERARRMMFPNFDCYPTGEPGDGTYMTKVPDTGDKPSCFVQMAPTMPKGNTLKFPHIDAADYSK